MKPIQYIVRSLSKQQKAKRGDMYAKKTNDRNGGGRFITYVGYCFGLLCKSFVYAIKKEFMEKTTSINSFTFGTLPLFDVPFCILLNIQQLSLHNQKRKTPPQYLNATPQSSYKPPKKKELSFCLFPTSKDMTDEYLRIPRPLLMKDSIHSFF